MEIHSFWSHFHSIWVEICCLTYKTTLFWVVYKSFTLLGSEIFTRLHLESTYSLFARFRHLWGEPQSGNNMNKNITYKQFNYGSIPSSQNHWPCNRWIHCYATTCCNILIYLTVSSRLYQQMADPAKKGE